MVWRYRQNFSLQKTGGLPSVSLSFISCSNGLALKPMGVMGIGVGGQKLPLVSPLVCRIDSLDIYFHFRDSFVSSEPTFSCKHGNVGTRTYFFLFGG